MDFWSIAGSVIASIIVGIGGFLFGRWQGWWLKAKAIRKTRAADGTQFTILVAELDGDADNSQHRHIRAELEKQFPPRGEVRVHVLPYPEALAIGHGEVGAALARAETRGRQWLKAKNADVLIWGEQGAKDKVLRLRFLTPAGEGSAQKPYELGSTLELHPDFGADLGAILAVQAATAIRPVYERSGEALAEIIAPVTAKLQPLAENPPVVFADETKARLWHAYAAGEDRLGEERVDNARLQTAIRFYRQALDVWTRERVPLKWAMTQNNLGGALQCLGERGTSTARLQEAVQAYREALKEWPRARVPLRWAAAQNNLGSALESRGKRETSTARLQEAIQAYREALKEWTRERAPVDWARAQNNLGNALSSLGERDAGTARLQEAVQAYRQALKEWTRERVPLDWARTQNNLGNALLRLGEREASTEPLLEAVQAYREALKEWTRERVPLDWARAQNNLGGALARLGERESGTARLEDAAAAFREALKERTRERVPLDWATAQNNLGVALLHLGEQESGTARLEDAAAAFREALKEYTQERVPLRWAMTQNNLGSALSSVGERQAEADKAKGCAALEAARGHFAAALEVYRKADASYYVGMAEGNIARLEEVIGRVCG